MYSYQSLQLDIQHLARIGAETGVAGRTVLGRHIPYVHLGVATGPQIIVQGAIHAREHITAQLVTEQAYYALTLCGEALKKGGIWFLPMVNVDGVMLCNHGIATVPAPEMRRFLLGVNGGEDFSMWKANINAVDLNTNFPARWGSGTENAGAPAPANYIGPSAGSEPETQSLMALTRRVKPALTLSYHCKGREIYWQFGQPDSELARDKALAEELAGMTGYSLVDDRGSAGGYKDWCIQEYGIPAFTLEIVADEYPYPVDYSALSDEWQGNRDVPYWCLETVIAMTNDK